MLRQSWHKVIVAYRLEDKYGNAPYFYDGIKAFLPEGYLYGYMNPSRYRESDYDRFYHKLDLYEYLLFPTAFAFSSGEVLFKPDQVISKSKTGR